VLTGWYSILSNLYTETPWHHYGCGGAKVNIHSFLTLALNEGKCSALCPNHKPYYVLTRRPGGPHSWSGPTGKEKNVPSLLAIDPWFLGWSACILVTTTAHSLICSMYEAFSFQYQFCVVIQQPATSNATQTQFKTEFTGNKNEAVELRTYHTYWQGECRTWLCTSLQPYLIRSSILSTVCSKQLRQNGPSVRCTSIRCSSSIQFNQYHHTDEQRKSKVTYGLHSNSQLGNFQLATMFLSRLVCFCVTYYITLYPKLVFSTI
jgi:hypothetical protein